MTVLVTGASGLLGSAVCQVAAGSGRTVRGLVRTAADAEVLARAGIEPVPGDVTDPGSIEAAVKGVDELVHSAAVLGGTWSTATTEDFERVNYRGSLTVLDAARGAGVGRTVVIGSLIMLRPDQTATEQTPMVAIRPGMSAYARTKLGVYYEGMHRVSQGEQISFVLPGAMYGPSLFPSRALDATSFTGTMHRAIHLAAGGPDDALSLAAFCNLGCAAAGVDHRVVDVHPAEMGDELGSMRAFAAQNFPEPLVDPTRTTAALGVPLTPVPEGVERTVAWMRSAGVL